MNQVTATHREPRLTPNRIKPTRLLAFPSPRSPAERARYTTPTSEALIALVLRLQWITVAIECPELN